MNKTELKKRASAFVIFGATGDLTQNKIYPSLYELARRNLLPEHFYLYGLARKTLSNKQFQKHIENSIRKLVAQPDEKAIKKLVAKAEYIGADVTEDAGFQELEARIQAHERKIGSGILRMFYLALPPKIFSDVIRRIESCKMGKALCSREHVLSRVIVEKPFGSDYDSALQLDRELRRVFHEKQIYRIDHYLGKEAFQNVFSFRFANAIFEHIWNSKFIDSIQINALETVGLMDRFAYYDGAGALRDMVQSHLFQLLAYVMMEEPKGKSVAALHVSKERLLKTLSVRKQSKLIRGQYQGYRKERGVPRDSKTETYVALACEVTNARWKGVPIYIRTGKMLDRKETSIAIQFKQRMPKSFDISGTGYRPNRIYIEIDPVPSITMEIHVAKQGFKNALDTASMHYCRSEHEKEAPIGDYERLLMDVILGDQSLFTSSEEVLCSWKTLDASLKSAPRVKLHRYKKGSEGPSASKSILLKNHTWLKTTNLCPLPRYE